MAQGWGSLDSVTSPTFVLVNEYRRPGGQVLHHLDAYRLNHAWEAEELDLDLMLENGPLVLEWPERIDRILPATRLWVAMRWMADEQRGVAFTAHGLRYEQILADLHRRMYGGG